MGYKDKSVRNEKMRTRYKIDPEFRVKTRNRTLKYHYGITLNDYNLMFELQKGCCKTCNRHQSVLTKILVVDHCHITSKIRGLLCDYCNRLLGNYENKPELFLAFDSYLERSKNGSN